MSSPASEHMSQQQIVRAGAGAGKTRRLTFQVMDIAHEFLTREKRLPRLIVTTFTRKATQELRERLMIKALEDDPDLIDFVNSRSHLMVSTIHGVLDLYLKRYGGNICIDPGYSVMASPEAGKIARQVMRQVLFAKPHLQPLLETYRFARLTSLARTYFGTLAQDPLAQPFTADEFNLLFSQFTENLVLQSRTVISHIKAEAQKADWLAMAEEIQRVAHLLTSGKWLENRTLILDLITHIKTARFTVKNPPVSEETNQLSKDLLGELRSLSEASYDPAVWQEFASLFVLFQELAEDFKREFYEAKIRLGRIEISDLELLAMECIRKHPQTVEAFSKEWDYWLIDEYQDTSPFQVELLRQLTGEKPNFIVGDPQQSIYLFRGARSEVFAEKEKEILENGGHQELLKKNYRSQPELLLFLNDFFSRFDPPFSPMEANIKDEPIDSSCVVAKFYPAPAVPDEGADTDHEMKAIVAHVQELLAQNVAAEDICVLARTNQTLIEVASQLNLYEIPTHVHSASGFYERRETRDALALLKFLVHPHDNFNFIELLRSPWFRIADESLVRWTSRVSTDSFWDRARGDIQGSEAECIGYLASLLVLRAEQGITEVFKEALRHSGFIDFSLAHDMSGRRESNIWKLLARLAQDEGQPGFNYLGFIENTEIDLRESAGQEEGDAIAAVEPNRINLMTIHSSKGLQFRHVLLPRLHQSARLTRALDFTFDESKHRWAMRIPLGENGDMTASLAEKIWVEQFQTQELAEHARVLYVALTRAVDSVFLSWTEPYKKNSWAEMMRWDLSAGIHHRESYSYEVLCELPQPQVKVSSTRALLTPKPKWRAARAESLLARQVSVSDLLERAEDKGRADYHQLAGSIAQRLRVASEGTAVHRLMELLKYPSQNQLGFLVRKWFPNQEDKVLRAIEFVRGLQDPPVLDLIQNGEVEWGFAIREGAVLIEGQVDLWGRAGSGVWIVDYKTGNPVYREKAFEQMALYALALRKSGLVQGDETIHLAAIYPFSEKIFVKNEPELAWTRRQFEIGF